MGRGRGRERAMAMAMEREGEGGGVIFVSKQMQIRWHCYHDSRFLWPVFDK